MPDHILEQLQFQFMQFCTSIKIIYLKENPKVFPDNICFLLNEFTYAIHYLLELLFQFYISLSSDNVRAIRIVRTNTKNEISVSLFCIDSITMVRQKRSHIHLLFGLLEVIDMSAVYYLLLCIYNLFIPNVYLLVESFYVLF